MRVSNDKLSWTFMIFSVIFMIVAFAGLMLMSLIMMGLGLTFCIALITITYKIDPDWFNIDSDLEVSAPFVPEREDPIEDTTSARHIEPVLLCRPKTFKERVIDFFN